MKFLLLDANEKYIGPLKNVTSSIHPEILNGEDILEISSTDPRIKKGCRILYHTLYGYWKEFIVQGSSEMHEDTIEHTWLCESSFYETIGDLAGRYIEPNSLAGPALASALLNTRWEVGIVSVLSTSDLEFFHMTAREAVQQILERIGGELRTRIIVSGTKITARKVDILQSRGQALGKRFVYTKDLTSVTRVVQNTDVITALYGYGQRLEVPEGEVDTNERVDFSSINDGYAYVEDAYAKGIWGRNHSDGTKVNVYDIVYFDDISDPVELRSKTLEELDKRKTPKITYECKVIDLKAYGKEHEGAELGDTVRIIDRTFIPELRIEGKVIEMRRNLLNPLENEIVLGNYRDDIIDTNIENNDFIRDARSKVSIWDRANIIGPDGTINAEYLNNIVKALNDQMNSRGGYVYMSDTGDGIITYDKPVGENPTMAIQLLGGAFRIANSKLPNGEWDWRTFGDGDGFVADMITTGVLQGGMVKFDLSNGTFLIGNSVDDYLIKFDGNKLSIKLDGGNTLEEQLEEIENSVLYKVELSSSNGNVFTNNQIATTLTARVWHGVKEVTDIFPVEGYVWRRVSDDAMADTIWEESRVGVGNMITLTDTDVNHRATFFCDIY